MSAVTNGAAAPAPAAPRGGRIPPLPKRWRWVGGFSQDVMLCAASAAVGPFVQSWWAVVADGRLSGDMWRGTRGIDLRDGSVRVHRTGVKLDLSYARVAPVEVNSLHDGRPIWTAKQGDIALSGSVHVAGATRAVELRGLVDDSAGRHARHTSWTWSCGVGIAVGGEQVAWNLVEGLHDGLDESERTVWIDGVAHHVPPQAFAADLSQVAGLAFTPVATRTHSERVLGGLFASAYEQPFGNFYGELPVIGLVIGYGVMERHEVTW